MTANRNSGPPVKAQEGTSRGQASGPPPPPVRRPASAGPPPPPQRPAASEPPVAAQARPVVSQPPPPPKRSRTPEPSLSAATVPRPGAPSSAPPPVPVRRAASQIPSQPPPNPIRRPSSNAPAPLAGQGAAPLAPWSPPVQGRPVTLPAFDAAVAPLAAQDKPAASSSAPGSASAPGPASENPFSKRTARVERPAQVPPSPPVERSTAASPFAPTPSFAPAPSASERRAAPNPFLSPPSVVEPSPSQPAQHPSPVEPTPIQPAVQASPVEPSPLQPVVPMPQVEPPAIQPAVPASPSEPTPIPPALHVSFVAPSPIPPAVQESPIEPTPISPALQVSFVEPAPIPHAVHASAVAAPLDAPAPVAAPYVPVAEPYVPVVSHAQAESHVQANAFETAPTEFAASETPIVSAEADASAAASPLRGEASTESESSAQPESPSAELSPAQPAGEERLAASNGESVVVEAEIQEQAPFAQPFPAPRPFSSSGSEMPVVITTPPPLRTERRASASNLVDLGRELLPRAGAWTQKKLRSSPRALVIGAPLAALLGILAVRGLVSRPKPAAPSEANGNVVAEVAAATPAAPVAPAAQVASAAAPSSPILVSTGSAPAATPPTADSGELSSAISHGLPALEALAQKFPKDAQVALALASQQAQAQRFEAAIDSIERAIAIDPKSPQNGKVMGILWRAAQSGASEASFAALRKLGARGSDIAFDLATTAGVRDSVRERAKGELDKSLSPEASEDTRVASALLLAPSCDARKALLSRAEREGGKRTQTMLEQFSRGSACTSSSDKACNACLTGSPELSHALSQLSTGSHK
ncbi:MAG TPA: hypothetical protein VFK05_35435 [Polyangiaceae bacterium]|nr:hypothetical protein [Polyangiaceae bacterium]